MTAHTHGEVFGDAAKAAFAAAYPKQFCKLEHTLTDEPLLTLDALATLAAALPEDSIEYNPGALPIGIAPEDVPASSLGVVETIRNIGESGSWVVLKRIEQIPAYAALLESVLGELNGTVFPRTGEMLRHEGFIFVSSPNAVTPFHFDPEHNILLQLAGSKTMTLFPAGDEAISPPRVHEAFHMGEHHRNLPYSQDFAGRGTAITINPGEAIHVPVKSPHWVQVGPGAPSISLSITWRSEWSYAEADARAFNRALRKFGLDPASPRPFPARNMGKALIWRAIERANAMLRPKPPAT
ncbi:cupin-like domain-containing protein [Novosphingobium beihaiensis]|uniref:Cupin-like domain-containing protein n=1 Tax=Novosphingobium beihaiensis TaxID=2930389 RepID=A0ABT0BPD1_9SPHN|nr:cupin-like domain-containing protein [Novosphingobium beihaiensis]MCJ2186909.1 cupin-like domain-containing protein [Novosphingobium beihaiensis]